LFRGDILVTDLHHRFDVTAPISLRNNCHWSSNQKNVGSSRATF